MKISFFKTLPSIFIFFFEKRNGIIQFPSVMKFTESRLHPFIFFTVGKRRYKIRLDIVNTISYPHTTRIPCLHWNPPYFCTVWRRHIILATIIKKFAAYINNIGTVTYTDNRRSQIQLVVFFIRLQWCPVYVFISLFSREVWRVAKYFLQVRVNMRNDAGEMKWRTHPLLYSHTGSVNI